MFRLLFPLFLILSFSSPSLAQLHLLIQTVPADTPEEDIYVAGNFNNWSTNNPAYRFNENNDGTYGLTINVDPGELKFKFTRGDWDRVEGDANGNYRPDRIWDYDGNPDTLLFTILSWEDSAPSNSTAAANVTILDDAFEMPQLNQQRRIWLYLPPDYATSNKRYPVLYMHDGQNLFDQATSFGAEWQVDESLNTLHAAGDYGVIVVGIDNGGLERLPEYTPWPHPDYSGSGKGPAYVNFIVETLKPHIDQNYRTLKEPKYTGIMGSSLGGLISTYGIIEHQDVFGKAGLFSSSYWLYNQPYDHVTTTGRQADIKVYLIAGQQESQTIDPVSDMYRMEQTMETAGFDAARIRAVDHADGQHSEWYWAREFPTAYQWLFGDLDFPTSLPGLSINEEVTVYPNPGQEYLVVELVNNDQSVYLELYNTTGQMVSSMLLAEAQNRMEVKGLPVGIYHLQLRSDEQVLHQQRWVKGRQ